MKLPRKHALVLSLALGGSLAAGGYALTQTSGAGVTGPSKAAAAPGVTQRAIARKNAQLDALERSLDRRLADAEKAPAAPEHLAPRIVRRYVRASGGAVVTSHHGDDEGGEHEGGEDD